MTISVPDRQIQAFIDEHQLPEHYRQLILEYFAPTAKQIVEYQHKLSRPILLGINGCQGSGKSTLSDAVVLLFESQGLSAIAVSIDDFYLTKEERHQLSHDVHPLLQTRGVPGTHDIPLAQSVITDLLTKDKTTQIPRFDKSIDDRADEWDRVRGPVDIVILEGWCVGALSTENLDQPINTLERNEDDQGIWRNYVNQQLSLTYQNLFSKVDVWLMLKAPAFANVFQWRKEQEDKLRQKVASQSDTSGVMNDEQLRRFVDHYQRVTENLLTTLPKHVHFLFTLSENREILSLTHPIQLLSQPSVLIFTDMDGTLLDHHTYSHQDADKLLGELEQKNIPVMACTSKTAAELIELRKPLNNRHPFIAENGAAVFIPIGYFPTQPEDTEMVGDFWVKSFVEDRETWIKKLHQLSHRFTGEFRNYANMTVADIAEITGLSESDARLSAARQFSEPVLWEGSDERKRAFIKALNDIDVPTLQGGRFIHLSGQCDKGKAMMWLTQCFVEDGVPPITISAGDSQNDIAMLEASDCALLIPSPVHTLPKLNRTQHCWIGTGFGPTAWAEGITRILTEQQLIES